MTNEVVARVARNLSPTDPSAKGNKLAAVSIIIRDTEVPSILLIKRAERSGDPWSGQIAFPGGKMQSGDLTARDTAVRETREEVGIDLSRGAEFLGYAEAATTHTGNMEVVPSVFVLKEAIEIKPNVEVSSYRWVDLEDLLSPKAHATYDLHYEGKVVSMPAVAVADYVVWGLTHRILTSVFRQDE